MFGLGLATKIYVAVEAVDMRKGFEGLYGLVRDSLGQDPLSGHLFLESSGMGRQRAVGMRQASGEGAVPMAGSGRQAQRHNAAGGVGDAGERAGCEAGAATQVVSAFGIKSSGTFSLARVK
jgi:hypothetical protein